MMQVVEVLAPAAPDVVPQYGMYLRALSGEGMDVFMVSLAVLGGVVVFGARAVGIVAVYGIGFRAGYLYAAPLFARRAVACLGCAAGSSVQLAGAVGAACAGAGIGILNGKVGLLYEALSPVIFRIVPIA